MKKKLIVLLLILSLLVVMTACSGETSNKQQENGENKGQEEVQELEYPTKPVQIIVPVPAGGDTDYNARVLAETLEKYLGKPVVVTNIDGAATVAGMQKVLDSDPDGHTLVVNGTDVFVPKMLGNTDIDLQSFKTAGITLMDNTTVVAVHKDSGIKTLPELVEASKKDPEKLEYGMKIGATNHIFGVAMSAEWGTKLKNVDVGNNAAKMTALLARQTDVININYSVAKDYFETGEFIALALLGSQKNEALPDIPLAEEYGMKNLDFSKFFWLGMHPDTPDEIVEAFAKALKQACEDPGYIEKMEANYLTVGFKGPQEAHDFAVKFFEDGMLPYKDDFLNQ